MIYRVSIAASLVMTATAHAQTSRFTGRVLADSGLVPLAGAELSIRALALAQRTNTKGEFRFTGLPAGEHVVVIRMPGFAPEVDTILVADAGEAQREFSLARIEATLPEVPVTTTLLERKLFEFYERRRFGMGRFLDSAEFAKAAGTRTSDHLQRLAGIRILRGRGLAAYVSSTRSVAAQGQRQCQANVWLDNLNIGTGFDVNTLDPSAILAVEWYAGLATPARFAVPVRPGQLPYCGTLVIWLR